MRAFIERGDLLTFLLLKGGVSLRGRGLIEDLQYFTSVNRSCHLTNKPETNGSSLISHPPPPPTLSLSLSLSLKPFNWY